MKKRNSLQKLYGLFSIFGIYTALILCPLSVIAQSGLEPVYAKQGMVAGPESNAVHAGVEILQKGGNAFDAAAAVGFSLAVTYPAAGNLGGGGFMTAVTGKGEKIFLDFRETAPLAAHAKMYQDNEGNIIPGLSTKTLLAVGVPGTVHGLLSMQERYGLLHREEVLSSAVHLAESGFSVPYSLHRSLLASQKRLSRFPSTAKVFYPNGHPPEFATTLRQPDLAWTLKQIQQDGRKAFYEGKIADKLVRFMKDNGGMITKEDLQAYRSKYREPIVFSYKDHTIVAPNLPSSGGFTLAQILKLVESYPLREMGFHSADYIHTLVEAERLAFADRNYFLGDADFVKVPMQQLLSESYFDQRRQLLPPYQAGTSDSVSHGTIEHEETTHFCVVDKDQNVVAITYTLNGSYGMGAVVEGAGFFLNNEMDDFNAKPNTPNMYGLVEGEANAIQPGKRMLSSMTPTIVLQEGDFAFTVGTPGGPTIITTVAQTILNQIEFDMNIREAIDAGRFHHQWYPDLIRYERLSLSPDTIKDLVGRGYTLYESNQIGFAAGIERMENGLLAGYSDSRGEGHAEGY